MTAKLISQLTAASGGDLALTTLLEGEPASGAPSKKFTLSQVSSILGLSTPITPANGGTGIANNNASTLTISGNFATTLTVSGTTGVTLPTTGTLATLAGSETLSAKTLRAANGTSAAPTISFASETNTGFFFNGATDVQFSLAGTVQFRIQSQHFIIASTGQLEWGSSGVTNQDIVLVREAAGTLRQRDAVTQQKYRVYDTNSKYLEITHNGTNGIIDASSGNLTLGGTATAITTAGSFNAASFSAGGTAGVTAGPFTVITSITVKNGLVTALIGT